jgi:endonuclease/exonuclease/phosphatase family metal-dependent hydrolase
MRTHPSSCRPPVFALLAGLALIGSSLTADEPRPEIRVMSFNIRYGTAADGENHWDKRKEFLVETIKAFDPDLLGTQETLGFQRDFLAEQFPGHAVLGVGRDDGQEKGEMMALYYRKDRFDKVYSGHFWLSESPDDPGSKSWDSSLPRMVTWVKLTDCKKAGKPIVFFNTHFDHRGPEARRESARLLRRRIDSLAKDCGVIVTGDFNAGEKSPPYQALFAKADNQTALLDCFRLAHPQRGDQEGTASGFRADATGGARIDWIACTNDFSVTSAEIDRTERGGRTPSDHFPVKAALAW